ncbi:MAG TPA: hypothetical protein VJV23_11945 [Candidatus Polarisedimenticolia bacterium]|nr:hypothetical protein [Candidatus Polarisedimenticolia bacterium]
MLGRLAPPTILAAALTLSLAHAVPPLQGRLAQAPPQRVFLGFRYMAGDHHQYAAFIRQARDTGALRMHDPFTTEPHAPVFVFPFFWVLGLLSRLLGGSIPLAWDAARCALAFAYVIVFWRFTAGFFQRAGQRTAATVLFAFGGGLDWIAVALARTVLPQLRTLEYPLEYFWNWSTFGTAVMPNWVWPALLTTVAVHGVAQGRRWAGPVSALLLPVIWLSHAYTGMVAYLLFGLLPVVAAARKPAPGGPGRLRLAASHARAALPALLSFLPVGLYLLWATRDPVFEQVSGNGWLWTIRFSLAWYPLSYGLLLPLGLYGAASAWRERTLRSDIVLAWLAAAFLLSVNPWYAPAKFHYLLYPPLALLAARGAFALAAGRGRLARLAGRRWAAAAAVPLLFLNAPVSLLRDLPRPGVDPRAFLSEAELAAMRWLETRPAGPVLSSYNTGNVIPWLAGKPACVGHWFLTVNLAPKLEQVMAFFSPRAELSFKREILRGSRARYIYYGPEEARYGRVDPALGLAPAYEAGGVAVYELQGQRGTLGGER